MIRFEHILDKVESYKPDFDEELLQKAYIFSAREHRGQVRSSGEPYLVHPLNVAHILADLHLDETSIAVGLLHDVLEDTLTTKDVLEQTFGEDVAELVDGVTKISRYAYVSKEEQQAETFRKMLLAMVSDLRVVLVKLADRLHNMRTLEFLPEERRLSIAKETMEIYAPIANRLGIGRVKNELEDLAFRFLHPRESEDLQKSVSEKLAVSGDLVERIKTALQARLRDNEISGDVNGRVKSMYSIWSKLQKQDIDIGQLYDTSASASPPATLKIVTRPSASSIRCGVRFPAGSRTTSRCPSRTSTSRCTRRSSRRKDSRSKCRSVRETWT